MIKNINTKKGGKKEKGKTNKNKQRKSKKIKRTRKSGVLNVQRCNIY